MEYGGYLPLELNPGLEWFAEYEKNMLRFNSVKAALVYLLDLIKVKKIYIPYYYCPSTQRAIKEVGIDVLFYHINSELLPYDIPDEENSAVLLVDYFGVRSKKIKEVCKQYTKANVIMDSAHAFFAEPLIFDKVYMLYSAKKFFGVPDGAYLIGKEISEVQQFPSCAHEYAMYLLKAYENGANAAYFEKKMTDQVIANTYDSMSKLTIGLLRNVNYERIQNRRSTNYSYYQEKLGNSNMLSMPMKCNAYMYPCLLPDKGRTIKQKLIENRVYVPTLWSGEELMQKGNSFELSMMRDCIFLPIDQRYDIGDIEYIVRMVEYYE